MAELSSEDFLEKWYVFSKKKLGYKESKDRWLEDRKRGQIDLFWLAKNCLKLDLVDSYVCSSHPIMMGPEPAPCKICGQEMEPCPGLTPGISVHREICNAFVHKNPDETLFNQDTKKTRAIFAPRGSYKSSIDRADCAQWVICFPDIRILIFSASPSLGTDFVTDIKKWFTYEKVDTDKEKYDVQKEFELFQQLYPEHLINPSKRSAGCEYFSPARIKGWVEPTIFTLSLEGNTAGYHADVGKFDDCVSEANSGPMSTPEERTKVGQNIRLKRKLIIASGFVDFVGTPYNEDDAYSHLLEHRRPEVVLVRPAWEVKPESQTKSQKDLGESDYNILVPIDGKGAPLLPYKYLKENFDEDEHIFNCQFLCTAKPTKDAIVFSEFVIDAHTISTEGFPQAGTYKIFSVWDVASSDGKGSDFSVGGVGLFAVAGPLVGRMFVAEITRGKFSRYELPHQIAAQAARWRVEKIGIEKSPGADFMENDIMRELQICGYPECPVPEWIPVDNQKNAKALRIEGLAAFLEQDRLYFSNEISLMETVKRELIMFKRQSRRKDDTADMIALLSRYMPKHIELPKNEAERQSKAEEWLKQKMLHDMIYDPAQFIPAPPEPAAQTPTEWEGYPVVSGPESLSLYGS